MLQQIKDFFELQTFINTVIVYGTHITCEANEDLDICVILDSEHLITEEYFKNLILIRRNIFEEIGRDIDLIPHTMDETKNINSPLYSPRYNPPLVFGTKIKGELVITSPQNSIIKQSNIAESYLSLDRTIIRRLICRDCSDTEINILFNKIQNISSNILNYLTLKNDINFYNVSKCDIENNLKILDLIYENDKENSFLKLLPILDKENFLKLPQKERDENKIQIGEITEQIFENFFTKKIDLSKFDLRIKNILSKKEDRFIE